MKRRLSLLSLRTFIVLIGWVVIVTAGAGIYHLTHRGVGSGSSELIMCILLVLSAYLIREEEPRKKGTGPRPRRLRTIGVSIILTIAAVLIAFSIYHLLTHGWRSAITEASLAVLLLSADYIVLANLGR